MAGTQTSTKIRKGRTAHLYIAPDVEDPLVFVVSLDAASEPDAIPVIPTRKADAYWVSAGGGVGDVVPRSRSRHPSTRKNAKGSPQA